MDKEDFECGKCDKAEKCVMKDRLQRLPREYGGLGLCPKVKEDKE